MKTIKLDTGVEQFKLPGGVLRFNPADPNVYVRFQQALESLQQLEQDMAAWPKERAWVTALTEPFQTLRL